MFGKTPTSTMKEYLENSAIKETEGGFAVNQMVSEILNDFEILVGLMLESIEEANKVGDVSTADLATKMMKRMEKRHWMFTAFSHKN